MKQYVRTMILICVGLVAAMAVFALIAMMKGSSKERNEDILKLNDITSRAAENWGEPDELDSIGGEASFVVLDNENRVVYRSDKYDKKLADGISPEKAVKEGLPYRYVEVGGRIVGCVIMVSAEDRHEGISRRIIIGFTVCGIVFIAAMILFGVYVNKNIITPFNRMEEFAGKIAEGNLDAPLMMNKNNMFGAFTESFDIMRTELKDSKQRELELQRKEKELVASLSHDLKTPITGIKLTTELMKAKVENSDNKDVDTLEKLDNIYLKADQMDTLVSDLFSATLEDLGEFKVSCRDEESGILSAIIRKNDSKDLVSEGEKPKLLISIDSKRMSQVLGNIISNSYKYAGTGIDVEYKVVDRYLNMTLRDHGPGVPKEELDLLTNKFYRSRNAEEKEGSGLGLYIASSLMKKMGGELICDSDGSGFIVTLLIPLS